MSGGNFDYEITYTGDKEFYLTKMQENGGKLKKGEQMSGGSFDYAFADTERFAEDLESKIKNNHIPDEYDYAHGFSLKTVDALKVIVAQVKQSALMMKEVEWLYSGDIDEEEFIERAKGHINLYLLADQLDDIAEAMGQFKESRKWLGHAINLAGAAESLRQWGRS